MDILKFNPIFKPTLWGSETWVVSAVKGSESVATNGIDKGLTLPEIVSRYGADFLGKKNTEKFGTDFPLLIKFIDARQDLSIQVHPDDEIAQRHGKSHGKTEMWYAFASAPGAVLYNGLKRQLTPEVYEQMVENDTITEALARYEVSEGDVFFIPAGRIHAIGAGCFVAEIQQTSDITYRIYDYKRKDKNGNYRELHTKEAAESIDFRIYNNQHITYELSKNEGVQVVSCPHFTTVVYDLTEPMTLDYSELDSFVILIAVKGQGKLICEDEESTFQMGDTVLLPATTQEVKVEGNVKFLETYV
jgi:mannose-6-phosphate isomerase